MRQEFSSSKTARSIRSLRAVSHRRRVFLAAFSPRWAILKEQGPMISLILKNVYRNRRTYFGYLLAATLAVATFLCFGFFVFHPGLTAQHLPDLIVQLIVAGELGVAVFA